jgi:alpha-L-fucosidase 2
MLAVFFIGWCIRDVIRYNFNPMKFLTVFLIAGAFAFHTQAAPAGYDFMSGYDVKWNSLGTNENDSMPIGNGDLAANAWTEQNGDLVLLLAKADAWTELGKLVKLGRVRIQWNPNPFAGANHFTQVLKLENGSIELKSGKNTVRVWVDANRPAMHIEAHLERPADVRVILELWRVAHPLRGRSPDKGGMYEVGEDSMPVDFEADTVFPAGAHRLTWCHYNTNSIYPFVLQHEHLDSLVSKFTDPLLHRCFGATLTGAGLMSVNDRTLKSSAPARDFNLDLVALTETNATSTQDWENHLEALIRQAAATPLQTAWQLHQQWWKDFWNRSWIYVEGSPDAQKVSQGYAMQRYMMACSSRGTYPVKFNGGLFTVGHDIPDNLNSTTTNHNPDFRAWGNCYWNQNNRLLYWPLIAAGDYDLLKPWFGMYLSALPLAKDRTQIYYHHDGASLPETMFFFGLPSLHDFGWNNPSNVIQSTWQRYHIQGTLEVIAQMLDYYDNTGDTDFARSSLVPFADAIVTFYDQRFSWFWKPAHDWIPDLDNGGDGMITLQNMLMQCDGKRIILLPAWPKDWTADFKLHAPFETTVEGHAQNGKIIRLQVRPESRAKDAAVWNTENNQIQKF